MLLTLADFDISPDLCTIRTAGDADSGRALKVHNNAPASKGIVPNEAAQQQDAKEYELQVRVHPDDRDLLMRAD